MTRKPTPIRSDISAKDAQTAPQSPKVKYPNLRNGKPYVVIEYKPDWTGLESIWHTGLQVPQIVSGLIDALQYARSQELTARLEERNMLQEYIVELQKQIVELTSATATESNEEPNATKEG